MKRNLIAMLGSGLRLQEVVPIKLLAYAFVLVSALLLTACGGGGGGTSSFSGNDNQPPVLDLGADRTVNEGEQVVVPVTVSDPDGSIADINVSQLSGPQVSVTISTSEMRFSAPSVSATTVLTFEVTATDNEGASTDEQISITVRNTGNQPPRLTLGADRQVQSGQLVIIDVSASDSDGTITDISGTQTAGPEVIDGTIDLNEIRFTAPQVSSTEVVTIEVVVTDNDGATASAQVNITVVGSSGSGEPPTVNLGADIRVDEGANVSIALSFSDADGNVVDISGTQIQGPPILDGTISTQTLEFTAPQVDQDEVIVIQVTVTDNDGLTGSDTIAVTVRDLDAEGFRISGEILPADQNRVDVDVNDTSRQNRQLDPQGFETNNETDSAQLLSNPAVVNGYVSVVGSPANNGAPGNFETTTDPDDFYSVRLLREQFVSLRIADFDPDNPGGVDFDLALYDDNLELVASSLTADSSVESVMVPRDGEYFVRVNAFAGYGKYVLNIGNTSFATGTAAYGEPGNFIAGEIVVTPRGKAIQNALSTLAALNLVHNNPGRAGLHRFTVRVSGDIASASLAQRIQQKNIAMHDTLAELKRLRQRDDIAGASLNYRVSHLATPNDPFYVLQSHYQQIRLSQAWDNVRAETASPDVVVAVIDTGVVTGHEDLAGSLIAGYDFIRSTEISGDGDGIDPDPEDPGDGGELSPSSWHGTHVSGTIAASTNNGIGVAGVSWGAKIMPVRVLGIDGGTFYDVLQGVRFAAGLENDSGTLPPRPADIINLSLGGAGFSQSAQDLFDEVAAAGVIVVAAAGNENSSAPSYPAAFDNVVSVSAVDLLDQRAPYSNFGDTVDLAAPGGDLSVDSNGDSYGDGVLSTLVDEVGGNLQESYQFYQGTSMAAPHVAGVAALMKTLHPALTPEEFQAGLVAGELTRDIGDEGRDNSFGYGLVDALSAVQFASDLAGGNLAGALSINPGRLDFGQSLSQRLVTAVPLGSQPPEITLINSEQSWLSINEGEAGDDGDVIYTVVVDRDGLSDGIYAGAIDFHLSDGNVITIPVTMHRQFSPKTGAGDTGFQYVLLLDADSREVLEQRSVDLDNGRYSYEFAALKAGTYLVISGSDIDNNNVICELGESCGGYPTREDLVRILVEENVHGIDFLASIIADVVSNSTSASATAATGVGVEGIPLKKKTGENNDTN